MTKIIADSSCDTTPTLSAQLGLQTIPLTVTLGTKDFTDDETLDIDAFVAEMNACTEKMSSAAPAPGLYKDAMEAAKKSYTVTLSSNLSGSYQSAMVAREMAENAETHVFDSKSAAAGELLVVMKIRELLDRGVAHLELVHRVEDFIKNMKTYFVLNSLSNLIKNGRMGKVKGTIATVLNIKPLMGSDGDGNIAFFSLMRGEKQILTRLLETITQSGKNTEGECAVITHCNNPSLAEKLKEMIAAHFSFREIAVVHTRGLSSLYAADGGIVLAF